MVVEQLLRNTKTKLDEIATRYRRELAGLRVGRATPVLVEDILVEAYGAKMPLKQIAAILIPDAKTITVEPWDQTLIPAIERSIAQADGLGLTPAIRGKTIFINIPPLSEERRRALIKVMREKLEDARIRIRQEREKIWVDIQQQEKGGAMREDDKFRAKDRLQELVDEANKALGEITQQKEREILEP